MVCLSIAKWVSFVILSSAVVVLCLYQKIDWNINYIITFEVCWCTTLSRHLERDERILIGLNSEEDKRLGILGSEQTRDNLHLFGNTLEESDLMNIAVIMGKEIYFEKIDGHTITPNCITSCLHDRPQHASLRHRNKRELLAINHTGTSLQLFHIVPSFVWVNRDIYKKVV